MATSKIKLGRNSYGKSKVRLLKVSRSGADNRWHDIRELTVDISLSGDFDAVHTRGDNSKCLPTDTMKNTVYALAKDDPIDSIESFATRIAAQFVETHLPASRAVVAISESAWARAELAGGSHPHTFVRGSQERADCTSIFERAFDPRVSSGLTELILLKSADSAFSGFTRDNYTTLRETEDRIFCTSVSASWRFGERRASNYNEARRAVRQALIETFAAHESKSVQQTLYAMGEAALARCDQVESIHLIMPNKHCLLVDLSPFGLENKNEIFVPTDEPHGLIEATVERA